MEKMRSPNKEDLFVKNDDETWLGWLTDLVLRDIMKGKTIVITDNWGDDPKLWGGMRPEEEYKVEICLTEWIPKKGRN